MRAELNKLRKAQRGVSMIETLVVLFVTLITAAMASPNIMRAVYNTRLRSGAGDLAGLMQQARILAAKDNRPYAVRFTTLGAARIAFIDLNLDGAYAGGEPQVQFVGTVAPAPGAPSGSGGQPSPYVLAGDTGVGSYDNTTTLGFSPRGLPCNYDTSTNPATCTTPAVKYFGYYLTDTRMGLPGWTAVVVTKAGRTKVVMWDGTSWH
ncbi:MAG TPA: prepilin-type N-terminal cleavage/methylation domain-containing protein [Candidatus Acidoferrum sp.]|nr:prepilin-type N-terminal cleavage/methylation domain-containing protein [Candidatus Acidoferrum sp.]